jgi:hypothetical protein
VHRTLWCTPDSHCSMSDADLLPNKAQSTVAASGPMAHRTLSGAHRTVRCPLPTVGVGHASPADCAADRCSGGRWLTRQSGASPDNPVNFSRTPSSSPESGRFTLDLSGAPPDTVRCTQTEQQLAVTANSFPIFFSCF